MAFLTISISGWFATLLVLGALSLPYLIRSRLGERHPALAGVYRERMHAHYWIGFTILGLTLLHMAVSVVTGMAFRADTIGILVASAALVIVVGQVLAGLRLRQPQILQRVRLRHLHFTAMIVIIVLTGIHVALNSPLASGLRSN